MALLRHPEQKASQCALLSKTRLLGSNSMLSLEVARVGCKNLARDGRPACRLADGLRMPLVLQSTKELQMQRPSSYMCEDL
jgi:hypothetical protein